MLYIYSAYVSKHNSNCEKHFIPLMIPNWERWFSCSKEKLSGLLREITAKHQDNFYSLNCLYSSATENKSESP